MEENGASEVVWKERYSGSFDMEISGRLWGTRTAYLILHKHSHPLPLTCHPIPPNFLHSLSLIEVW